MPTVGWIYEDAVERCWDGQPRIAHIPLPPPVFVCTWCGRTFSSPEKLRSHFSLEHPLELPTLSVQGQPLLRKSTLRAPIVETDVELLHCSRCEVQINGAAWHRLTLAQFRTQFAQPRNAAWNVRLIHERSADNSTTTVEYHIQFLIPDSIDLDAVDAQFIRTLALEELTDSDLNAFQDSLPIDAPTREYAGALGDYALGIMLKERRRLPRAPIGFEEFAIKMRSALEILRLFYRPLALAISSSIRFNLNDFHDYGTATATELEAALVFFRSVTGETAFGAPATWAAPTRGMVSRRAICPIDQISHRLLSACGCLSTGGDMSLAELNDLRQLTRSMTPLSEQDLAKVHVICAEGYLRLDQPSDALLHLRAIQFNPSLKDWAQHRLEDVATYGN